MKGDDSTICKVIKYQKKTCAYYKIKNKNKEIKMTEKEKQQWKQIKEAIFKNHGINDPEKIDKIVDEIYSMMLEKCSVIESEKIIEILYEKIRSAKSIILREPLSNILKYKKD